MTCATASTAFAALAALAVALPGHGFTLNGGKWFPADVPVPYSFNPSFDEPDLPDTGENDECRAGFLSWESLADSDIAFVEAAPVSLTACPIIFRDDGQNVLTFSDPCDELDAATLAVTVTFFTPGETMTTNGTTFVRIRDADILFSEEHPFTDTAGAADPGCSGAYDIRAVATHEIGHFIGLGHTADPAATMFATLAPCDPSKSSLDPDDQAGAAFVYPPSSCSADARGQAFPDVVCAGDPTILSARSSSLPGCAAGNEEYRWQGTNGFLRDWSADPDALDAPAATTDYTVDVRCVSPSCTAASAPVTVTVATAPVADAGAPRAVCPGGSAVLGGSPTGSGGMPPYFFSWLANPPDPSLSCVNCENPTVSPGQATTYTVFVFDSLGCDASATTEVTLLAAPTADAGPPAAICPGDSATLGGSPTASGGLAPYTYAWTAVPPDPTLSCTDCENPQASPAVATTYTVEVTDAGGCTASASKAVSVAAPVADAGPDRTSCPGTPVTIGGSPTATGGVPGYVYLWTSAPPDPTMSCTDCANPEVDPAAETVYTVDVTDAAGCPAQPAAVTVTPQAPSLPPGVGNSLMLIRAVDDMTLSWIDPGGSASGFRVYRSDLASPPLPWDLVGSAALPPVTFAGELAAGPSPRFYRVVAVNCAGVEGP